MQTLQYESRHPDKISAPARPARKFQLAHALALVFILAVVVAALVPIFDTSEPRPKIVRCGSNERQLVFALAQYAQQNGGSLPPSLAVLQQTTLSKPSATRLFTCPVDGAAYIYVGQSLNLRTVSKDTILIYESPTNHKDRKTGIGSMNVGYADGRVISISGSLADKIIAELKAGHNPPRPEMLK